MGVCENKDEKSFYGCYGLSFQNFFKKRIRLFYYLIISCQYFAITLTASNSAVFYLTRGISIDWLAYLGTVSAVTIVVFEFPTGLISDRFGSAVSIVISMILRGGASLAVAVCYGPAMFCLITLISSVGGSFYSGAGEAWIFSRDKAIKEDMGAFFSNLFIVTGGARIVGGFSGALLAAMLPEIPFVLSGLLLLLLSGLFILFESGFAKVESEGVAKADKTVLPVLIKDAKNTMMLIYNNERLFHMTLSSVFFIAFCGIPLVYWQPFFYETMGSVTSLGGIWAGFIGMNMLGSSVLKISFIKRINDLYLFCGLIPLCGLFLFLAAFMQGNTHCSIAAFFSYQFFLGVIGPVRGKLVNREIVDNKRASILSCISFFESIGSVTGFSLAGYISKSAGLKVVFILSIVPLLISFLSAIRIAALKNKKRDPLRR